MFRSQRAILCAMVLGLARPAFAAPDVAAAKVHFRVAIDRFGRGDLVGALESFEQSYRINPEPDVQYNIGVTLKRLGRFRAANQALVSYLARSAERAAGLSARRLKETEKVLEEVRGHLAAIQVTASPRSARVLIGGEEVPAGEASDQDGAASFGPAWVDPGSTLIEVSAEAHDTVTRDVSTTARRTVLLRIDLRPTAVSSPVVADPPIVATPPPVAPSPVVAESPVVMSSPVRAPAPLATPIYKRWWLWTIVGVGVAAGVAIGLGVALTPNNAPEPAGAIRVKFALEGGR